MTSEQILKELEELADRSGITIRYEKGDFDGGYCVLKAERLIVVNRKLPSTKKGSVVAQAIAEVGVEEVYLKPVVREFIEEELSKAAQEALRAAGIAAAAHQQIAAEATHVTSEPVAIETTVEETPEAGPTQDGEEPSEAQRTDQPPPPAETDPPAQDGQQG